MEYQKRFGLIVMVTSIVLIIVAIVLSTSRCYGDVSGFNYVMYCMHLSFFAQDPSLSLYLIDIPTKYMFIVCSIIFALGFLWYQGAIKAPLIKALGE